MNQAMTTRQFPPSSRQKDISVFHFKRFLAASSASGISDSAEEVQRSGKFRVLHVKRTLAAPAVIRLALVGRDRAMIQAR